MKAQLSRQLHFELVIGNGRIREIVNVNGTPRAGRGLLSCRPRNRIDHAHSKLSPISAEVKRLVSHEERDLQMNLAAAHVPDLEPGRQFVLTIQILHRQIAPIWAKHRTKNRQAGARQRDQLLVVGYSANRNIPFGIAA